MTSTYTLNSICETDGYDPGYYATIINKHINVHFNCLSLFSRREKVCTVDPKFTEMLMAKSRKFMKILLFS